MKRFKNASDLSNINAGDKVSKETLSPRSVYSQAGGRGRGGGRRTPPPTSPTPPPTSPTPPISSLTAIPELHPLFKIKLSEALEIIDGQLQADEIKNIKKSGLISGLTATMMAIPKLQILGSGIAQIGTIILSAQVAAAIINAVKPGLRGFVARNIYSLPELKLIKEKKYDFKIFDMVPNSNGVLQPSPTANTKPMTLEKIGEMFSGGAEVIDDLIVYQKKGYAFANDTDVDNINQMFKRNDTANKIDAQISGALPFATPAAPLAYLWLKINASDKDKMKAAEEEKSKKSGVYTNPTPEKKQQMDAAKQEYLNEQKRRYGPKP